MDKQALSTLHAAGSRRVGNCKAFPTVTSMRLLAAVRDLSEPREPAGNRIATELNAGILSTAQQANCHPVRRLTTVEPVPGAGRNHQCVALLANQFINHTRRMQTNQRLPSHKQMNFSPGMTVLIQTLGVYRLTYQLQLLITAELTHSGCTDA